MESGALREHVEQLIDELTTHVRRHYGHRLVSLVVFGSAGRDTMRPDSDLDLLIVADGLPNGRMARVEDFAPVETALADRLKAGRERGFATECSPVFKTPEEVLAGSPLFLDMVDDARVLHDRDGFFAGALDRLRERLARLGARRIWRGNAWFWDLKPDYKPGEVFEL
ncbi:MAG: nucleotidyltransferase family protein [Acidobacteriota bacterium]